MTPSARPGPSANPPVPVPRDVTDPHLELAQVGVWSFTGPLRRSRLLSKVMPLYRTQVSVATTDNVQANYATNTYHVLAPDEVELALWHSALVTFYTSIDVNFSPIVRTTDGLLMKSYDLSDPEPRVPVLTFEADLAPGSDEPLPTEVALCMSFQAGAASGVPQARRRNRVFLPFFRADRSDTDGRPSSTLITDITTAAGVLLAASGPTSSDWQWVVYSPTDDAFDLVDNGWIDNEWDTQRRRGRIATARTTF